MGTRDELVAAVGVRCRGASREEKGRILEEFVAVSGYCRKHAARLLHRDGRRGRSRAFPAGHMMTSFAKRWWCFEPAHSAVAGHSAQRAGTDIFRLG